MAQMQAMSLMGGLNVGAMPFFTGPCGGDDLVHGGMGQAFGHPLGHVAMGQEMMHAFGAVPGPQGQEMMHVFGTVPGQQGVPSIDEIMANSTAALDPTQAAVEPDGQPPVDRPEVPQTRPRRGETLEQAQLRERREEIDQKKCHLHKKAKTTCKFCQKHQELLDGLAKPSSTDSARDRERARRRVDRAISEDRIVDTRRGLVELSNSKSFGFSGLLQTHVVECAHFKSLLSLETFDQLLDETYQFATGVEPYMANSGTLPSALFCCLYRFFTLGLDVRQLRRLIDSSESPYIRCCGFLYIRYGLPPDQLWSWLGEYVLDDEEFSTSPEAESRTTIGHYVEALLSQDKYFSTVLPRLPMVTKRQLEEKLSAIGQFRLRTKANKQILDEFRQPGVRVEACVSLDEWLAGRVLELDEDVPTRIKVITRLDDGTEESVHLGKVILCKRSRSHGRRSRSRSRSPKDWSRHKGRSTKELVDELRSRDREKAVCSGKDYARKPVGYKAACALPRDQGAASYRLMEEETFVPVRRTRSRRSPSPETESFGKRPSLEHQARMQQLFEKYGAARPSDDRPRQDEVDHADHLRLG